jgi:hypothetical protein
MVKLGLFIKANLDGVTDLTPTDTPQDPYFYTFKVVCNSCHEVNDSWVTISRQVQKNRHPANAIGKSSSQWQSRRGKLCMEMQKLQSKLPS